MLKQAYIAISLSKRQSMQAEIDAICEVLEAAQIKPFIFVDRYHFSPDDAVLMMQTAKSHMDESEFLIAELSHKAIGVGLEVGYMAAQGKTIFYLRREDAEHSTTVGGMANVTVVYRDVDDLREELRQVLPSP